MMRDSNRRSGYFLDANIFVRFLTDADSLHHKKAIAIFEKIRLSMITGYVHSLVVHEAVYVLTHQYNQPKKEVCRSLSQLLALQSIEMLDVQKKHMLSALKNHSSLSVDFPDCLYAELIHENELTLLSFDKDFKKLDIKRVEAIS